MCSAVYSREVLQRPGTPQKMGQGQILLPALQLCPWEAPARHWGYLGTRCLRTLGSPRRAVPGCSARFRPVPGSKRISSTRDTYGEASWGTSLDGGKTKSVPKGHGDSFGSCFLGINRPKQCSRTSPVAKGSQTFHACIRTPVG